MPRPMIDWRNPDYTEVYQHRALGLARLEQSPGGIGPLKQYYKTRWAEFICDWMTTYDPRKVNTDKPPIIPFILFPRQIELVDWIYKMWTQRTRGLVEKSRDEGASWIACACAVCIWLFFNNANIGFGSRKEELVDNGDGDPDSLFWKIRFLIRMLPPRFVPADYGKDNKSALVVNQDTGSTIKGEIGDAIGMGGRTSIYFVDEADSLQHQMLAEASLSATTDCRIDVSTTNQVGSVFYNKRRSLPEDQVFILDWTDDPRKRQNLGLPPEEEPWYIKQKRDLPASVVASQIDRNPSGAVANTYIPISLIEDAEGRPVSTIDQDQMVPWRVGVDASGMGNDETVIWCRRGRISLPPHPFRKLGDGVMLAMKVEEIVRNLLKIGPVELISVERDGPGGSCADQLLKGDFASIVKAVHTGKKLSNGRHYNLRAYLHSQAKEYLEEAMPHLPKDPTFKAQGTALLWLSKGGLLLIESKDDYRKRLSGATSIVGKMAGRSPDRWDAFVLTFVPPTGRLIKQVKDHPYRARGWTPLDSVMGY